jgi:hypothetical protein
MHFFAVIDLDGVGRLSLGDHISPPQKLPADSGDTMVFRINQSLTVSDPPSSAQPSLRGSPPLATTTKTPVPVKPSSGRAAISLTCNPRIPFLDRSSVMLVGYNPADLVHGQPRHEGSPTYLWKSEPITLTWPILLNIPTPSDVSLFIVLDVNGDGLPSKGDLSTTRVDLTPSGANPDVQRFALDQGW